MSESIAALRRLNDIISSALDSIETRLASSSLTFPSLDEPYDPSRPAEAVLNEPAVVKATSLIVAAASQLIASVTHPAATVRDETYAMYVSPCIRAVIEGDVVEIVRDAGPKGIHADEIAKLNETDAAKTARILRILANRHIFKEVSPDVFALNRIASIMDTGKSVAELRKNPAEKHIGTSGFPALVCKGSDECMLAAAHIPESYANPKWAHSNLPTEAPFNLAFKTTDKYFEWYQRPENAARASRFGMAMLGASKAGPPDAIMRGFDWSSLPSGSTVVDVGGGIGSASLVIAQRVPHLKFVVQDRENVVEQAQPFWNANLPSALTDQRVELQARDFFEPQPAGLEASAYLLRYIIHDWPDAFAKKILKRLREAATPTTKLVVVDIILPYTCRVAGGDESLGGEAPDVPEPLLPSLGPVSNMKFYLDALTFSMLNGQERTAVHFSTLAAECGWKVVKIYDTPGLMTGQFVAVPA